MIWRKSAAVAAALALGALVLVGCHDGGHHDDHHYHAYRYERDRCDEGDWHPGGDHYRHREYARHADWHDAGYYSRRHYDR